MKVELHLHTSRYSGCSIVTPEEAMGRLIEFGYDAVYITEHDAFWPDDELHRLREKFPEIRIFPGVELSLGDQHLLVLGTSDAEYLQLGDAASVIARARSEGHLTVACHPFRWKGAGGVLEGKLLPDAIEYRSCNHSMKQGRKSVEASVRLGLPLVNGGDVHALSFIGKYWLETTRPVEQADDIRRIVLAGEYENGIKL